MANILDMAQQILQNRQTPQDYARENFSSLLNNPVVQKLIQTYLYDPQRHGVIPQIQQRVAQTPILPFIPQLTPKNLMQFQAPGEQLIQQQIGRLPERLHQPVQNAFPITQVPSFVGENVRQAGRFAGLQPTALDIAIAPFMFMGGVKAKPGISKKLSVISKDLQPLAQEAKGIGGFTPTEMVARKQSFLNFVTKGKQPTAVDEKIGTIVANTRTFEEAISKARTQIKGWKNKYTRDAIKSDLNHFYTQATGGEIKVDKLLEKQYGVTKLQDAHNAAYIGENGKLLGDLADHQKSAVEMLNKMGIPTPDKYEAVKTLQKQTGLIRLHVGENEINIDAVVKPNEAQLNIIKKLAKEYPDSRIVYDITNPQTGGIIKSGYDLESFLNDVNLIPTGSGGEIGKGGAIGTIRRKLYDR